MALDRRTSGLPPASPPTDNLILELPGKAGLEDGFGLIGGSCIIAPTGEIAAQTLTEDDELVICPCDLDLGDYIKRTVFTFDKHRRIEHYKIIPEQTGVVPAPENP